MRQTALLILTSLLLSAAPAAAEEPLSMTVTPPSGKILLTEPFKFKVDTSLPERFSLKPDTAAPEGSDFELVSFTKAREVQNEGRKYVTYEIEARAFSLGISTFPSISWRLGGEGAPADAEIQSSSFTLEILPLFKTKEGEGIRDIYPPFRYIPWLWLLALALAAAAAYYYYRGRRGPAAGGAARGAWLDPRTPYQRARDRLEKLEKSPLAADGRLKEFYTGLTSVLRLYLAEEFSIDAALMTTAALSRELKKTGAEIKTALRAREFLQKSDLVKFARLRPEDAKDDARDLAELLMDFQRAADNARALAAAAAEQKRAGAKP